LRFVREVDETCGHPSEEAFEEVRDAGYTDEQILEMIAHVGLTTYSNYMNDSIGTELDVPVVEPVQGA
jgi:alkylhydroperoxidase family enzyme